MSVSVSSPRPSCLRCHKPAVACVCGSITPVDNRTSVLVLQHPRERLHAIGTARFASLGLNNARVEVAWHANRLEHDPPAWLPAGAGLLYPAAHARDLRELPRVEHPRHLVVLDGTWHTARTLYRDKAWLHALPHYRLLPQKPGQYRIRREPRADYVSTIEAIVEALQILEPETQGLPELLRAFDAMIDYQIAHIAAGSGGARSRSKRRPRAALRIPHALVNDFSRTVVVYGDSSRPRGDHAPEFVYFGAIALATGASFEAVMLPASGLPDAQHMQHMGLAPDDFRAAWTGAQFAQRWGEFLAGCEAPPLVAAWNQRTLELLAATTRELGAQLSLKSAYRAVYGKQARGLDEALSQRDLRAEPNPLRGRAARRLGGAVAIARFLNARAAAAG